MKLDEIASRRPMARLLQQQKSRGRLAEMFVRYHHRDVLFKGRPVRRGADRAQELRHEPPPN
jgi:hypothetical protein